MPTSVLRLRALAMRPQLLLLDEVTSGSTRAGRRAILEEAPPGEIFTSPREERTRQFLDGIIAAGRL